MLLGWGAWKILYNPHYFPVHKVQIYAPYYFVSRDQLQEKLKPFMHANFFSVDLNHLKQTLLAFPSVADVTVWRLWPSVIRVTIHERRPIAHWGREQFIAENGVVFEPIVKKSIPIDKGVLPEEGRSPKINDLSLRASCDLMSDKCLDLNLPWLFGPLKTSNRVLQEYKNLSTILMTLDLRMTWLRLKSDGQWSLRLNNGMLVVLGAALLEQRLSRFMHVYSQAFGSRANLVARVDLRYPSGMAVKWRTARRNRTIKSWQKKPVKQLIVGLDIGTSKVAAIVGEVTHDKRIEIMGIGVYPSRGLKRGVVVNVEATVQAIQKAVEAAELMTDCAIRYVYAGISGSHVRSLNSNGIVAIRHIEVTQADVDRVIDAAKAVAIPADQKILHILPQEFTIDKQTGIKDPIGMSGVRLEANVHMITGGVSAAQNIVKCIRRCGLQVSDIILEQLASSHTVLSEDEKELGVCLVDIGGGTTDIAVFSGGAIQHTAVIPIAGDQVTNDIAIAFKIPTQMAESIKLQYACALPEFVDSKQILDIPSAGGGRSISSRVLADVVSARYEELFALVYAELQRSTCAASVPSIVLTGGAVQAEGALELAEAVFKVPVRLGASHENVVGLSEVLNNPIYATGIGLLLHGHQQQCETGMHTTLPMGVGSLWQRMGEWFRGNF